MTKDEPVAYFDPQKGGFYWAKPTKIKAPVTVDVEPLLLYTTPQQGCDQCGKSGGYALYCLVCAEKYVKPEWIGLTDEEIFEIWKKSMFIDNGKYAVLNNQPFVHFAKEIEAKLKEKNT